LRAKTAGAPADSVGGVSEESLTPGPSIGPTAFYTVTDSRHFLGAVGLLNSLRLVGHDEPLAVLDCGMTARQRQLLEPHATIVVAPDSTPPTMLKTYAPLARPADVMILLDADVIVTSRLDAPIELAAGGKVVAFGNDNDRRFFPEWGERLGLGTPQRRPYVAAGHLFVPQELRWALERFEEYQAMIDVSETGLGGATPADPFFFADMDVLNAMLATIVDPQMFAAFPYSVAPHPPFAGVRLLDARTLRCAYADGSEPMVLHHTLRKPWLARTPRNVYSLLLGRLLLGDDVALRVDPADVPLRLRQGPTAALDRLHSDVQAFLHVHARGRLGLRPKIQSWLAARGAA
jgi:hypothetical protein